MQKNYPLSKLTTFKIGGLADYFSQVKKEEELVKAVSFAKERALPILVVGEGSNVLVSDRLFKGLVIQLVNKDIRIDGNTVTAGAGVKWDALVEFCVAKGLQGIECLSGIPGTVGAAPYQNIGAYGQELKDTFLKLKAYDIKLAKFVLMDKSQCQFGYRNSIFKNLNCKNRYIIFEVTLQLKKSNLAKVSYDSLAKYLERQQIKIPSLRKVRAAVLALRQEKLEDPRRNGNAGSFFKNPVISKGVFQKIQKQYPDIPNFLSENGKVKIFAGWLIEKANWKGKKYKKVGVSGKNALVLINLGGGSAKEIQELAEKIVVSVHKNFGIKLVPEVQFINF